MSSYYRRLSNKAILQDAEYHDDSRGNYYYYMLDGIANRISRQVILGFPEPLRREALAAAGEIDREIELDRISFNHQS
jgi:hypothetical protein